MDFDSTVATGNNLTLTNSTSRRIQPLANSLQIFLGVLYIVFVIIGCVSNFVAGKIIYHQKAKLNSSSIFIPALGIIALYVSCIIPLNAASAFDKEFRLGKFGCQWYTFSLMSAGLTFITLITVIVIQVYRIIVSNQTPSTGYNWRLILKIITGSVLTCCTLAALPLFGVSEYEETSRPSLCCMRWKAKSPVETVFLLGALTVFLVVPCVLIPTLYVKIYMKVKSSGIHNNAAKRAVSIAKTFVLISGLFIFGWTPYSILAVMDIFGFEYPFDTTWQIILASFMAKLSILLMPTIYVLRQKMFKVKVHTKNLI